MIDFLVLPHRIELWTSLTEEMLGETSGHVECVVVSLVAQSQECRDDIVHPR